MTPYRLASTLLLCASTLSASAQSWSAKRIVFKNPGTFSQAQLEAGSGMHEGSTANAATMQAAAQKLADSGYFDDVRVVLDGTAANTSVVFTLAPINTAQMLPLSFENFIWLTPAEISAAIHRKFPLCIDFLPEGSPQADIVDAALVDALATKGVNAKVFHETVEPTLQHPARTLEFRVTSPTIRVANVHLGGVSPALVPLVQKSVNSTTRTAFNDGLNGTLTRDIILAPLLDAGYIQAALADFAVTPQPAAEGAQPVVISATLNPGEVYKLSAITFAGAPLLTAEKFASGAKLHAGDIASHKQLLETLTPLDAAYRREGYMDVVVTATPAINAATHEVAYTVSVSPGTPYHLNDVSALNLDAAQEAAFTRSLAAHKGDIYNPEYVTSYLKNNTAVRELAGCNAVYKATAYPVTHTVDLVLSFACPVQVRG